MRAFLDALDNQITPCENEGGFTMPEEVSFDTEAMIDLASALRGSERRQDGTARCSDCGRPAVCFGSYEGHPPTYACEVCCGHGNEDGWCLSMEEVAEEIAALRSGADRGSEHIEHLRSELKIGHGIQRTMMAAISDQAARLREPLTDEEEVDARKVLAYREKVEDPYALAKTIEHVIRKRLGPASVHVSDAPSEPSDG